jgi:hypothetical protein
MFSQTVYTAWLDQRAGQIFEKITSRQSINNEETLVLILKAQNDQLRQLAETMEERFEQVDRRFEQIDRRFEQLSANFKWGLIAAMGFLSVLMAVLKFVP